MEKAIVENNKKNKNKAFELHFNKNTDNKGVNNEKIENNKKRCVLYVIYKAR